jgi:hypothetical protein
MTDLLVPGVAAPEFGLIEPDLNVGGAERVANALRNACILRRVAEEYAFGRLNHRRAAPYCSGGHLSDAGPPVSPRNEAYPNSSGRFRAAVLTESTTGFGRLLTDYPLLPVLTRRCRS